MRTAVRALLPSLLAVAACADPGGDEPPILDAAVAHPAAGDELRAPSGATFVPGQLIVKLTASIDATSAVTVAGQRLRPIRRLPSGAWLMELDDPHRRAAGTAALAAGTLDALAAVTADPGVEWAYENAIAEHSLDPGDPMFQQQWQLQPSRVPAAWDLTLGSPSVRIAIIDSGTRPHTDLDTAWLPGRDFADGDFEPFDPIDPYIPGTSVDFPHGMHVAGVAGARRNGYGVVGVCPGCSLVPVRISLDVAQIEEAIDWVAGGELGPRRAEVINMSFNINGTLTNYPRCDDAGYEGVVRALALASSHGVAVVASAGNRRFLNGARFPANCPDVIGVAASGRDNVVANYSNRGTFVDLTAPAGAGTSETFGDMYGEGIDCPPDPNPNATYAGQNGALSTWMVGATACHRYLSGTSMAAPYVAGVIGLIRSARPSITPAEIATLLASTANTTTFSCPTNGCGAGLVDARAALEVVMPPDIAVSPPSIPFGNVQAGTAATPRAVTISNTGAGTLTYSVSTGAGFPLDCGGSCSGTLAAAQSRTLTVGFTPYTAGDYSGWLIVTAGDADEPTTYVRLTGTAITPLMDTPPLSLGFGGVAVGAAAPVQLITVRNSVIATMPLTFAVTSDSSEFPITCAGGCSGTLAPGQTRDVSVGFVPAAGGARTGTLTFTSNDLARPTLTTALSGTGLVPRISVGPGVSFDDVRISSSSTRNVTVANSGQLPLTYSATIAGAASFTLACSPCSGTLAPGETRSLPVVFRPTAQGWQQARVTFTSNDPSRPTVSVTTIGNGTLAVIWVSTASIDLGSVEVNGGLATAVFQIMSAGTAPLTAGAALDSPDFRLACIAACGALGAHGSRWYQVTFDPTTTGVRTGTVVLTSDDPFRPTVTVALRGTGIAPAIAVSAASLGFGNGIVGEARAQTITVQNPGTSPLVLASAALPAGFTAGGTYPATIAPGAALALTVTCTRALSGSAAGELVLNHNAGLATRIALSCATYPGRLTFEEPAGGTLWASPHYPTPVRVRNSGPESITITGVGFSDDPVSWFTATTPPLPVTLAAGQSLTWGVTCEGDQKAKHVVVHDGLPAGGISAYCASLVLEPDPPGFPGPNPPPVYQ